MLKELQNIKIREYGQQIERRDILKMGMVGLLGAVVPFWPSRDSHALADQSIYRINLRQYHTGEVFSGVYRVGDRYLPDAFERINDLMRDFRTGEVFPMDPRVLDIVHLVQKNTETNKPIEILSGYRSPKTNAMLRRASTGVARNSFHMYGQALDIRMPGFSTRKLRNEARKLRSGGVGYYAKSDFIHVDTGKVRFW